MKSKLLFILTGCALLLVFSSMKAGNLIVTTATTFSSLDNSSVDDDNTVGILKVSSLLIQTGGSITNNDPSSPANNSAGPVTIIVTGNCEIQAGGAIFAENRVSGGSGGDIMLTVGGNLILRGTAGSNPGAIVSSSRTTTGGSGNAGNINISVIGSADLETGSVISAANAGGGKAGNIYLDAGGKITINGLISAGPSRTVLGTKNTSYVLDGGNTTQRGGKIFIYSASLTAPGISVGSSGIIVSQGQDPASDTVHMEACGIEVYGLAASVSKKSNGSIGNSPIVILRSGKYVEVFGTNLGSSGTSQGQIRADYIIGEAHVDNGISIYATEQISISGPASGNIFCLSSGGGTATNQPAGTITLISTGSGITANGMAIQANATGGGSKGGIIEINAKMDIGISNASIVAKGGLSGSNPDGGKIFIRSFSEDILSNASSVIDVTGGSSSVPDGMVVLEACKTIGFPAGTIIPSGVFVTKTTSLCTPAAPDLPAGTTPLMVCAGCVFNTISLCKTDVLCYGESNGTVSVSFSGGTPPYSYSWSNGEFTKDISGLPAGTYSVTVTDARYCTVTASATLNEPLALITIITGIDVSYPGGNDGSADLTVSGGTPPYSFLWSNAATTEDISGLTAGTYSVTVTDDNGCTAYNSIVIAEPPVQQCYTCDNTTIVVDENVTVDFNTNPPAYYGDMDLWPYFSYDNSAPTADKWRAIFDIGPKKLLIKSGVSITVSRVPSSTVSGRAPGIEVYSTCMLEIEENGSICIMSNSYSAGDIMLDFEGDILINGKICNVTVGTGGRPGMVTVMSKCGNITTGPRSCIETGGNEYNGNTINILACGGEGVPSGSISLSGLLVAHYDGGAEAAGINIFSMDGAVTIDGNIDDPFNPGQRITNVIRYDPVFAQYVTSGVLVRSTLNPVPGFINIQAKQHVTVFGNTVYNWLFENFGVVAVKTATSFPKGGIINVLSLEGKIIASDRAFDNANRDNMFAVVNLNSKGNIELSATGRANSVFSGNPWLMPVVTTRGGQAPGSGGTNNLRSYNGGISIGVNVQVLADAGFLGTLGTNSLTSCMGITNSGSVIPADPNPLDDIGVCSPDAPFAKLLDCARILAFGGYLKKEGVKTASVNSAETTLNCYPNPSFGSITIRYNLSRASNVILSVYDVFGHLVETLVSGEQQDADHTHVWDATGLEGGIYFIRLQAGSYTDIEKIMLLK